MRTKYDKIEVDQYKEDWVECPKCNVLFNLRDKNQWTGLIHKPCGQRIVIRGFVNELKFIWCLKANIGDGETSRLKSGASVYLYPPLWGDGYKSIKVIGKDKATNKFIEIVLSASRLKNFKSSKVTKPDIISRLSSYWQDDNKSLDNVDGLAQEMNRRIEQKNN
jgi:phage FluMu protein Com